MTAAILIILMTLAVPTMTEARMHYNVFDVISSLKQDLSYARHIGLAQGQRVTLCPLDNSQKCSKNWQTGYRIFIDSGKLGEFEATTDTLLKAGKLPLNQGALSYTGGKYLTFDATGMLDSASGTFQYCHNQDKTGLYSKAVIINLNGRIRESSDIDNDGYHEKSISNMNSDLRCET
ncbi:GspH/FimT family pseudopilin [Saccharobesus litoralis]|nr:GspH/FimT family protein [Saccharobesus litoralis]